MEAINWVGVDVEWRAGITTWFIWEYVSITVGSKAEVTLPPFVQLLVYDSIYFLGSSFAKASFRSIEDRYFILELFERTPSLRTSLNITPSLYRQYFFNCRYK